MTTTSDVTVTKGEVDGNNIGLENSFEIAFGYEKNLEVWATVGINPYTRLCLLDKHVKHEIVQDAKGVIDVDADPLTVDLVAAEKKKKNCC